MERKNFLKSLSLFAASPLILTSCSKEDITSGSDSDGSDSDDTTTADTSCTATRRKLMALFLPKRPPLMCAAIFVKEMA